MGGLRQGCEASVASARNVTQRQEEHLGVILCERRVQVRDRLLVVLENFVQVLSIVPSSRHAVGSDSRASTLLRARCLWIAIPCLRRSAESPTRSLHARNRFGSRVRGESAPRRLRRRAPNPRSFTGEAVRCEPGPSLAPFGL